MIYLENMASALFLEEPDDIASYIQAFDYLRAAALSPRDSADMLRSGRGVGMTKHPRERGTPDLSRTHWRTSTYSGGNGDCVEVASLGHAVAVRDSKHPADPSMLVSPNGWRSFIHEVRAGTYEK